MTARQELVTVAFGTWLMVGLFVGGWSYSNLAELETFFTPWHALFYSGFMWTAAWVGWQALRTGAHVAGRALSRSGTAAPWPCSARASAT